MIKITDLWKRFGKLQVLAGLNLEVQEGETIVILGPSGIGKSVLLKHIIGLLKPDRGAIDIDGTRITDLEGPELLHAIRNMGMLFQGSALFDSMTVEENVSFYLKQHGDPHTGEKLTQEEITERVNYALGIVGLQGAGDKMPSDLSGGMRKRAALARVIVYRPMIVLYDEPTTGLDPIIAMQINELILKTQKELKATSIVVTHDMFAALYVGDRLALIRDGKIAQLADPDTFIKIDDPLIKFLYATISQDPRKLKEKNHHG
ncbi:MAG TPA: ATP-binding cassette domain-containing protein [Rhabdochlamydiaceae bacterium]|jgi:phospholipid/cholesterol/gamma-HCH transport system ATP-binding protein